MNQLFTHTGSKTMRLHHCLGPAVSCPSLQASLEADAAEPTTEPGCLRHRSQRLIWGPYPWHQPGK